MAQGQICVHLRSSAAPPLSRKKKRGGRGRMNRLRPPRPRLMPRAPSLELYVLPNGGGQSLQLARSVPTRFVRVDGAEGDRTPDLCSAIAALSQLSYSPDFADVPAFRRLTPGLVTQRPRDKARGRPAESS